MSFFIWTQFIFRHEDIFRHPYPRKPAHTSDASVGAGVIMAFYIKCLSISQYLSQVTTLAFLPHTLNILLTHNSTGADECNYASRRMQIYK
jgi:hypothetical protein